MEQVRGVRITEYCDQNHLPIRERLDYYSADDLQQIVTRSARLLNVEIDGQGAREIARRSRGTPRIA